MRSDSSSSLVTETGILIKRLDPETARKCVNQYQFLKELGRGTHGKVKLAVDMTDQSYWAVKIIPRQPRRKLTAFNSLSQNHSNQIKREVAIMKKVNHPAIVKVRELIDAPNSDKIFLVLEYLSGGEIIWDQHPLASQDCIHIFRKLVQGVNYLHSQGIIHRDIKPANLLKDSHNQIKISDFSVSLIYDECDQVEIAKAAGSPAFLAPEICGISEGDSDSEDIIIDPFAIDIWAMGVTLYCLAFGTLPFNGDNEFEVYHAVNNQPLMFPLKASIDSNLKDILSKMLDKSPKNRIKMADIKIHPYVTQGMTEDEHIAWINDSIEMINITDEDVKNAISIPAIIRRGLKMIKNRFFRSKKRSASMPPINNKSLDSSALSSSLRSHPSVPIMMPYLPAHVETRASDLRKLNKSGSGLISDNQSEVTDLAPDQPWVIWNSDFGNTATKTEFNSDDDNYEGISI